MGIRILSPGLLTTVQDLGRTGYQRIGISPSGAVDRRALKTANILVGNQPGEGALEMTMAGASMEFTEPDVVAVTGGNFEPAINGVPVPMYAAVPVRAGGVLALGPAKSGCRAYIAFAGGLDVPVVMGSKSTNLRCGIGGFKGRKLRSGDELPLSAPSAALDKMELRRADPPDLPGPEASVRAVFGPQDDYFTQAGIRTFLSEAWTVTNRCDRMGCALDGAPVEYRSKADIISDGIPFGAVQIPSDGKPIVMLSDRQTTGGYAKIAAVISSDLPVFAQRRPGDRIRFQKISMREAQRISRLEEEKLRALRRRLL